MQPNLQSQNPLVPKKSPKRGSAYWIVTIVVAIAVYLGLYYRQNIADYVVVQQFAPSQQLEAVLDKTYLSETGKFYVYASQTKIVDKAEFNHYCGSLQNEKSIVLGCYSPVTKQIAVYDVTDERLSGVREATTAHEMLHAVWDRLSVGEQRHLNGLLNAEATKVNDQRLRGLFEQYRQSDPSSMPTELHSIIGTEVAEVSPELEAHYDKYFSDRKALVAETKRYESVFVDIETRQTTLVSELDSLAASLNIRSRDYEKQLGSLNREVDSFNSWAESGYASASEFDRRRSSLMVKIDNLEADRIGINNDVERYNQLSQELESLNMLAQDLSRSLDSHIIQPITDSPSL